MMKEFCIKKQNEYNKKSFRVAQIFDQFDLKEENLGEVFQGTFDIPEKWNVGVIVGKSGTGKSTIAKELFGDTICNFEYKEKSVIDDFDKKNSFSDIVETLSSVGFSSPPSWIKPYSVLSNGEKMRVDLARAILTDKEIVSFDEFTSVVDREVAKLGSFAVQKAIRKKNKKFIAISCHYDILEWLSPDWVFCTDDMSFKETRGRLRRPEIRIDIKQTKGNWRYFSKYHYLNHSFNKSAREFTAYYKEKPVGFCAIQFYPMPKMRMMLMHRIVVLPDYQGLGIARSLVDFVADYCNRNFKPDRISLITSLNSYAKKLYKNKHWILVKEGSHSSQTKTSLNKNFSYRNMYHFKYKP